MARPARRFGDGMAILVGDFALVYADILLRGAPADAQAIFDELRVELCVGQSLDLVGTATARTDAATARRIATYKSGKYTVERPLHLGAALAGRHGELAGALSAIGLPMGEAFQLRDDVLGAFGESDGHGQAGGRRSPRGQAHAAHRDRHGAPTDSDRELLGRLGSADLTASDVAELQALFIRTGAVDDVEAAIERLVVEGPRRPRRRAAHGDGTRLARRAGGLRRLAGLLSAGRRRQRDLGCRAAEVVRLEARRRRARLRGRRGRGVRVARAQRRGQDDHGRDPRGLPPARHGNRARARPRPRARRAVACVRRSA